MKKYAEKQNDKRRNLIKFRVSDAELAMIDANGKMAGFATRAAYVQACVTAAPQLHLTEIARGIGVLGDLCNQLLHQHVAPDSGSSIGMKPIVKRIIQTCDEVSIALRKDR